MIHVLCNMLENHPIVSRKKSHRTCECVCGMGEDHKHEQQANSIALKWYVWHLEHGLWIDNWDTHAVITWFSSIIRHHAEYWRKSIFNRAFSTEKNWVKMSWFPDIIIVSLIPFFFHRSHYCCWWMFAKANENLTTFSWYNRLNFQ